MERYKNLTILGTSHISRESIHQVRQHIEKNKPEIIALELDIKRFYGLIQKHTKSPSIFQIGVKIWLLNQLGSWVEKKLGKLLF